MCIRDRYSVYFADMNNGFMVGNRKIYVTTDGGAKWVDESPSFSGDLYGAASNGFANSWAVGQNGLVFKRNQ